MFRRLVLAIIVLSLLLPVPTVSAVDAEALADAIRFRAEFGFDADPAHIAAVSSDPQVSRRYSVALSPVEAAEMERRLKIEDNLEPLNELLWSSAGFGGAYIDQAAGHVIVIGFTAAAAAHDSSVRNVLPDGARFRLREVKHSEDELRRLQAQVDADDSWLAALGTHALEIPVNPKTNTVGIGLTRLDDTIRAAMNARYGEDRISLYQTSNSLTHCFNRNHCHDPLRAGLQLYDAGCSTGFGVYSGSSYYLVTAGHCYISGHTYQHPDGTNLGPMLYQSFYWNSSFDGGVIPIPTAQRYSRIWATNASWYPVFSVQTPSQEFVGQFVCLSGRMRPDQGSCGTIQAIGFPFDACHNPQCTAWTHLLNQRSGNYPIAVGDSGGAIWGSNKAMGIQSSMNQQGLGIYGHISYMQSHVWVVVCLYPTCP
ncbi:MAG TPA: hypothetical protein VES62_07745 [Thermoleophilaceae bacterium]|nr:hypothetical protein [Thermoleophilaceae bacterium]